MDETEYVAWVDSCQHRLLRSAYLITGDLHRAEDLVQEALVKVALRWPRDCIFDAPCDGIDHTRARMSTIAARPQGPWGAFVTESRCSAGASLRMSAASAPRPCNRISTFACSLITSPFVIHFG